MKSDEMYVVAVSTDLQGKSVFSRGTPMANSKTASNAAEGLRKALDAVGLSLTVIIIKEVSEVVGTMVPPGYK